MSKLCRVLLFYLSHSCSALLACCSRRLSCSEVAPALAASLRELEADFCPPISRHVHDCLCVIEEVTCEASERNTAWICFRCWLPTTSKRGCHSDSDSEALHRPWRERQGRNSSRYVNEHSGRVDAAPKSFQVVPSRLRTPWISLAVGHPAKPTESERLEAHVYPGPAGPNFFKSCAKAAKSGWHQTSSATSRTRYSDQTGGSKQQWLRYIQSCNGPCKCARQI